MLLRIPLALSRPHGVVVPARGVSGSSSLAEPSRGSSPSYRLCGESRGLVDEGEVGRWRGRESSDSRLSCRPLGMSPGPSGGSLCIVPSIMSGRLGALDRLSGRCERAGETDGAYGFDVEGRRKVDDLSPTDVVNNGDCDATVGWATERSRLSASASTLDGTV
jgi:hypothetical protein